MKLKKIAGSVAIAGALGAGSFGLAAGTAQADPGWGPHGPNIPWVPDIHFHPGDGPGLPPGQVKKWCPGNNPPGHWIGGPHGIPCT